MVLKNIFPGCGVQASLMLFLCPSCAKLWWKTVFLPHKVTFMIENVLLFFFVCVCIVLSKSHKLTFSSKETILVWNSVKQGQCVHMYRNLTVQNVFGLIGGSIHVFLLYKGRQEYTWD